MGSTQGDAVTCSDGKKGGSVGLFCVQRLKRGFERTWFARLSSRPLRWTTGLPLIESMSPATREACSKGDWPEGFSFFAFEALSCPCATCSSDVEGGGLLADGQT
jgi:hypothetical protein